MSFLDKYLEENNLPPLPNNIKDRLEEIEEKLKNMFPDQDQFTDAIRECYPKIVEIVERTKKEFEGWKLTAGNVVSAFRFVISMANDVSEIVQELSSKIVPPGATPEEAHNRKIQFGKELTWFTYSMWNPKLIKWLPESVEAWVERKVIYWLSGMAIDWALDYFGSGQAQAKIERLSLKK